MAYSLPAYRRYPICSAAVLAAVLALGGPASAFNPDEGAVPIIAPKLADPALLNAMPTYSTTIRRPVGEGYVTPVPPVRMPTAPYVQPPAPTQALASPLSAPTVYRAPVVPVLQPSGLPPVDPAVAARAQAILDAERAAVPPYTPPPAAPAAAFVAPAPLIAPDAPVINRVAPPATPVVAPVITAAPMLPPPMVVGTPLPVVATLSPKDELSDETRSILSHVPANIDRAKVQTGSIKMDRVDPEIKSILGGNAQEESYEAVGLSIKVRRPGLDTNYELNRAYSALMGGDTQTAIETYKNIISVEPRNEDALFGLAATYHRLGNIEQARPLYGMLLKVNPNHREGLNNFLVLVSDESPQDALPELERLETRNPDFSPIPAQLAIVLDKMGYHERAQEKMLRALELAPDNMSYRYNLAVMLDQRGEYGNAAALYRALIKASMNGAPAA